MLSRKTIGFLLKTGIVAFALFFLYEQLTAKSSVEQFNSDAILKQIKQRYGVFVVVVLMMFLKLVFGSIKVAIFNFKD